MEKILINIIDQNGEKHVLETNLDSGLNLMEVVRDEGFQMGNCGGMALCASCHCYIQNSHDINKKSKAEEDMLNQLHNSNLESRLICQIPIKKELNGVVLILVDD
ncbi:MAG: ferredoxin [Flavobacteriales bacterium]|nr:ferredoxin [Flavobacteriales bacterium]